MRVTEHDSQIKDRGDATHESWSNNGCRFVKALLQRVGGTLVAAQFEGLAEEWLGRSAVIALLSQRRTSIFLRHNQVELVRAHSIIHWFAGRRLPLGQVGDLASSHARTSNALD
jgi:hypothetical protein